MNEGIRFEGRRVPIWNQQKGIFRPAVLRKSGVALTVQTSFRSPYDDRADAGDDRFVYRYRGEDPEHPDNVAMRLAMQMRRPILYRTTAIVSMSHCSSTGPNSRPGSECHLSIVGVPGRARFDDLN